MTTYVTTATGTDSTNNSVVLETTANMAPGLPIVFSGTTFGGIVSGDTYYIRTVLSGTQITLSGTSGGSIFALSTATGSMTAIFTSGGQQIISTVPPGEPLNQAFGQINVNFDQIFAAGPVLSNIQIANNTIRTLDTNGNLVLAPNGIGNVVSNVNVIPNTSNIRNLGSITNRWAAIYTQYLDVSGNINFSNVTVSGNIRAQNLIANANLLAGNVLTDNIRGNTVTVTATTGNINLNPADTVVANSDVSVAGNVTGDYFIGNGSLLTGVTAINVNANALIGNTLSPNVVFSSLTQVGTLDNVDVAGNVSATGNIIGNYIIGNGSQLTGLDTTLDANLLIGNTLSANVLFSSLTQVGTLSNLSVAGTVSANVYTGNTVSVDLYTGNTVSVTGNISGNYILGNGSQLTGLDTTLDANLLIGNLLSANVLYSNLITVGTLSNLSVAGTVAGNVYTGNTVSVTGNISAANVFGNVVGNIVGPIPASARILYVAKNGSDSNDGSLNAPFATIKAAMAAATSNTSVHVAPGTYTEDNPITIPANVALIGDNLRSVFVVAGNPSSDLFYMRNGTYVWGITIRDYLANGFSYDPDTPTQNVFVSPYIQNITSATTTGTAVFIDGNKTSSISTKAMILGFFTIINRGGIGVRLVNSAYSQAVNIYTIACDIGLKVESGAFCTLNGSDCSIGNYGLVADGVGPLQTSGNTVGFSTRGVFVLNGLTNGYPHVNTVMKLPGDPEYYTIDIILPNVPTVGSSTVTIQGVFLGNVAPNTTVEFFTRSSIIASAHTFEYVGAGTNPATALPQYGGLPIEANEVIQTNGGVVTFTSTDQKGNFKVGSGFTINQATGEITGDYFYRSLFAQMTPYILALGP